MNISVDTSSIITELNQITKNLSNVNLKSSINQSVDTTIDHISSALINNQEILTETQHPQTSYDDSHFESDESTTTTTRSRSSSRSSIDSSKTSKTSRYTSEFSKYNDTSTFSYERSLSSSTLTVTTSNSSSSSSSQYKYDDTTFETLTPLYDSDESLMNDLNTEGLEDLKKTDYVRYIKIKLKLEKRRSKEKKKNPGKTFNSSQIDKLILRAMNSSNNKLLEERNKPEMRPSNIKPEIINRLKTINSIQKIKEDQMIKIEKLGKDIQRDFLYSYEKQDVDTNQSALLPMNHLSRGVFYQKKIARIKSKQIEENIARHSEFYSDPLMMIGHLADTLPKHSENPDVIWNQLMKPLNG